MERRLICVVGILLCCIGEAIAQKNFKQENEKTSEKDIELALKRQDEFFFNTTDYRVDTSQLNLFNTQDSIYNFNQNPLHNNRPQHIVWWTWPKEADYRDRFTYRPHIQDHFRKSINENAILSNLPFLDFNFSQGQVQEQSKLDAKFSSSFKPNIDFYAHYTSQRDVGLFLSEFLRHNNLLAKWQIRDNTGNWYRINYAGNQSKEYVNGGMSTDTLPRGDVYLNPLSYPVFVENTFLYNEDHHIDIQHIRRLKRLSNESNRTDLNFRIYRKNSYLRFEGDSTQYNLDSTSTFMIPQDSFYIHQNEIGVRGGFLYSGLFDWMSQVTFSGIKFNSYNETKRNTNFELQSHLKKKWKNIEGNVEFWTGFFGKQKEYDIKAFANFQFLKSFDFWGKGQFSSRQPERTTIHLQAIADSLFKDDFENRFTQNLQFGTSLKLKWVEIKPILRTISVSKPTYLNANAVLTQSSNFHFLTQLEINADITWRNFKIHNKIVSSTKDNILRLPNLSYQNIIGLRTYLFKKNMDFQLELRTLYMQSFQTPYYNSWYNDFTLSEQDPTYKNQVKTDVYASLQVGEFIFSFLYDNVSQYITDEPIYYIRHNPIVKPTFRFAINWLFEN